MNARRSPRQFHRTATPRRRARGRGQALVEFALVFPIIVFLAFAFIDVGRAVLAYTTLTNAARQATRVATVSQVDPGSGPLRCDETRPFEDAGDPYWTFRGCAVAAGSAIGIAPADVSVSYAAPPDTTLQCASAVNVGCIVTITVTHQFNPITPLAGQVIGVITMSSTSQMPVERKFP